MKKFLLPLLVALVVIGTSACSGDSTDNQTSAPTTVTVPAPTTTTLPPTTTTTLPDPSLVWLNGMETVATEVSGYLHDLQLDDSPLSCVSVLIKFNKINLPPAPARYALSDKYYREFLTQEKTALEFCAKGDTYYYLRYLSLATDWLRMSNDALTSS